MNEIKNCLACCFYTPYMKNDIPEPHGICHRECHIEGEGILIVSKKHETEFCFYLRQPRMVE